MMIIPILLLGEVSLPAPILVEPMVLAQAIAPAQDGTGTIVVSDSNRSDIQGGTSSADGHNLFHSFAQFGLNVNQSANFLASTGIQNILGRVVSGDPSLINGSIQVSGGNPNLFLINPAGIIFGKDARLNVPADFTATTATSVGFADGWFEVFGVNDYANLVGSPNAFRFDSSTPGAIINGGNLAVGEGQNLALIGGTVTSTGTLTAPEGGIIVTAVPGTSLVRLSQPGNILSLEIEPPTNAQGNPVPITPLMLPELLTASGDSQELGLTVDNSGEVQLGDSGIGVEAGDVVVNQVAGETVILSANRNLALVESQLATTGDLNLLAQDTVLVRDSVANPFIAQAGGELLIEGKQGVDIFALNHPNSGLFSGGDMVLRSANTVGGDAHYWTGGNFRIEQLDSSLGGLSSPYDPIIRASGDVSFDSYTGTSLHIFAGGSVTIPGNIIITGPEVGMAGVDFIAENVTLSDGTVVAIDGSAQPTLDIRSGTTDFGTQGITGVGGDVFLPVPPGTGGDPTSADITIGNVNIIAPDGNGLVLLTNQYQPNTALSGGVIEVGIIDARANDNVGGVFIDSRNNIITSDILTLSFSGNAGKIALTANGSITTAELDTSSTSQGGGITLESQETITISGNVNASGGTNSGNISLTGDEIDFLGELRSIGGTLLIQPATLSQGIRLGDENDSASLDLLSTELAMLQDGFSSITIGDPDGTGIITITEGASFSDPVMIAGGSSLASPDLDNTWNITGTNQGNLINLVFPNGLAFNNVENLVGGSAADIFSFAGGSVTSLNGGDGENTLTGDSTMANTWNLTGVNSGTLNSSNFSNIQNLTGGNLNDTFTVAGGSVTSLDGGGGDNTLIGNSNIANTWNLTGVNSGTLNGNNFSNIQNLTGGNLNDTFSFREGSVTSLDGGGGSNTLIGDSTIANTWNLTGVNSGTLNSTNFSNIQNLTGGGGNNTLISESNINNTWTITGVDSGILNSSNFSNMQNLTGGNLADSFFLSNGASLSGNLNGGAGNLTLTGDELDFAGTLSGSGSLILQPATSTQSIQIGGTDSGNSNTLDLTSAELSQLADGFTDIVIGREDSSSTITIAGEVTFSDRVTLQSGLGSITHTGGNLTGNGDATITLLATQDITTGNITTDGQDITLQSTTGAIFTGNLNASGIVDGGNIQVLASTQITTEQINSSGSLGRGGDVILDPSGDIQVSSINAQGGTFGGVVDITTGSSFRATDTFTAANGLTASISSFGSSGGGSITIRHGGNGAISFNVGDARINGTAGAITSRDFAIAPVQSFLFTQVVGDIQIISVPPTNLTSSIIDFIDVTPSRKNFDNHKQLEPVPVDLDLAQLEFLFTNAYEQYLGGDGNTSILELSEIQAALSNIEKQTGVKPALIYAYFISPGYYSIQSNAEALSSPLNQLAQPTDELELILVTPSGPPIRHRVDAATREKVEAAATKFRREIEPRSKIRSKKYLQPAKQLYDWLVSPLQEDLKEQEIENLVFIMDEKLRSLPLAAMHNGDKFIIEEYSIGLMPSISLLINTDYVNIQESPLLGMGITQFPPETRLSPLPGVRTEINTLSQLRGGTSLLDNDSTINTLTRQQSQQPYLIVHLATHAKFQPGTPENSYIQFHDKPLKLNREAIRGLGLNNLPVELLVLSACETAIGDIEAELGFAGSAHQAGVKSVLASLWEVNDIRTLGFMARFYDELASLPIKAEALRQAQLAMQKGEVYIKDNQLFFSPQQAGIPLTEEQKTQDANLSHPHYWSGFTLIGSPW
ncbi:MAG: CHAT domain-containing protein [Symploca sp. SIO2E6]|nr:CHAT domain-containing protein [Symploca sp. SIO2E6]